MDIPGEHFEIGEIDARASTNIKSLTWPRQKPTRTSKPTTISGGHQTAIRKVMLSAKRKRRHPAITNLSVLNEACDYPKPSSFFGLACCVSCRVTRCAAGFTILWQGMGPGPPRRLR